MRARSTGENGFLKIYSVLFFLGKSKSTGGTGQSAMIAANDSGGPVVSRQTGKIIAIATETTAVASSDYGLPAIGIATSVLEESTMNFIASHAGK